MSDSEGDMGSEHKLTKVIVPGTFDPITAGHLDVIKRAATLFDEVIVAVAQSEGKGGGPLFSIDERVALAREATAGLEGVSIKPFSGLLVDFAHEEGAAAVVKGLRAMTDFEYEFQQAMLNYHLAPDIETVHIMASPDHMYLSSSAVKEIGRLGGDISGLVPDCVGIALRDKFDCVFGEEG